MTNYEPEELRAFRRKASWPFFQASPARSREALDRCVLRLTRDWPFLFREVGP